VANVPIKEQETPKKPGPCLAEQRRGQVWVSALWEGAASQVI
jgi:hypothetical protein